MTVETATYINQLNATYPTGSDQKQEGDDHLRLLKSTIKATFPNITGAVTTTHTVLNKVGTTATAGDNSTDPASTAFVQAAIAAVNAQTPLTLSIETGTAVTGVAGSLHVLTNVAASTVTLPAAPTSGQEVGVIVANELATNVVARNGGKINGLSEDMTINGRYASFSLKYINSSYGWAVK